MSNQWEVGQAVAIGGGNGHAAYKRLIERVTPSGRAVIGRRQFAQDGFEIGGGRWRRERIVPWTAEHEAKRREAHLVEVLTRLSGLDHIPASVIREAVEEMLTNRKRP